MLIRKGQQAEREDFFMMGFDAWGDGKTQQEYLDALRTVARYDLGSWYVLEGEEGPVAALIVYRAGLNLPLGCWGIGSVATAPEHRRQGYAAVLMRHVVDLAKQEAAHGLYLFSGVDTAYYAQFGFECVNAPQADGQAPCMLLSFGDREKLLKLIPDFF